MITRIVIKGYRAFRNFEVNDLTTGVSVIVGDNQAGKSTLLEAVSLALTGRVGGRWARDELNPHWFNQSIVSEFFKGLAAGEKPDSPTILIEIYLAQDNDDIQHLRGIYNSAEDKKSPGLVLEVVPDPEYAGELEDYLNDSSKPSIIPVEYYKVIWRGFNNELQQRRPRGLGVALIDSRTIRNPSGIDYYTREMLADFVDPKEKAAIAIAHRKARHDITKETLADANHRIQQTGTALHDRALGLQMDQSAGASWESSVVPSVDSIPFGMAGQGQQAAIKVALAMNRRAETTGLLLLEEPENHLSHTSLRKLIQRVSDLAGERQVLVTTHSSFVLNRLGLDQLILLHGGRAARLSSMTSGTVRYFQRLSGYDTLRLVLAEKVVLVEGPSDEMIFSKAYWEANNHHWPIDDGVDVVAMQGVTLARSLELATALDRRMAVLRDNDNKEASHWEAKVAQFLNQGARELFIGDVQNGHTLEPQIVSVNEEGTLRGVLKISADDQVEEWMLENKTEAALRIYESSQSISYPDYILDAIEFLK